MIDTGVTLSYLIKMIQLDTGWKTIDDTVAMAYVAIIISINFALYHLCLKYILPMTQVLNRSLRISRYSAGFIFISSLLVPGHLFISLIDFLATKNVAQSAMVILTYEVFFTICLGFAFACAFTHESYMIRLSVLAKDIFLIALGLVILFQAAHSRQISFVQSLSVTILWVSSWLIHLLVSLSEHTTPQEAVEEVSSSYNHLTQEEVLRSKQMVVQQGEIEQCSSSVWDIVFSAILPDVSENTTIDSFGDREVKKSDFEDEEDQLLFAPCQSHLSQHTMSWGQISLVCLKLSVLTVFMMIVELLLMTKLTHRFQVTPKATLIAQETIINVLMIYIVVVASQKRNYSTVLGTIMGTLTVGLVFGVGGYLSLLTGFKGAASVYGDYVLRFALILMSAIGIAAVFCVSAARICVYNIVPLLLLFTIYVYSEGVLFPVFV